MNILKEILLGFRNVMIREVERISHDKDLITILLLAPLIYAFYYSTLYINKAEKDVPIAVVDMDNSGFSEDFIKRLDAHENISVSFITGDLSFAKSRLDKMEIHGIVYIPQESEKNLKLNNKVVIKSFLNTSRFLVSNDINKAVTDVAFSVNDEVRQKYFLSAGLSNREAENAIEPVNTDIRPVFNVTETYGDFLIPGILIMILHQTLLIGLAESIAKEREEKTLGELYSAAYYNTAVAIAGKSFFYFILFGAYSVFNLTIVFSIFRINLSGNIFILSALFSLLLISVILMCFLISSFFKRKILALQIIAFTSYPLFFITGYAFPRHSIPPVIRSFSDLFAITPFFEAYKRLTQMGAGFNNILPEFIHILILTIVLAVLALLRMHFLFRKEKQKDV